MTTKNFSISSQLVIAALCLVALPVSAQTPPPEFNDRPPQASMAPASMAPAAPGGLDKWHAPPVPSNWGFPDLNVRVANFAVDHLTQKVGNGECWTLAKQALVAAGAVPPNGYVFGRELAYGEPWLPGDIIQFTSCQFVNAVPGRRSTEQLGAPNHTAIIYSVGNGQTVILQQNVNGDKHVQTETLNFSNMVSGKIQVFQPLISNGRGQVLSNTNSKHHSHKKHKNDDDTDDQSQR